VTVHSPRVKRAMLCSFRHFSKFSTASFFFPSSNLLVFKSPSFSYFCCNEEGREIWSIRQCRQRKVHRGGEREENFSPYQDQMDVNTKTSKLHDQEAVDKYLAIYGFRWSPGIKIMFCPTMLKFLWPRLIMMVCICILSAGAGVKATDDEVHS